MAGSVDPGTQRRRLGRELRRLREHRSLTQSEAAKELEWSLTKIIRIEKGGVSLSVTDLRALAALYEETNRKKVSFLADLARSGHGKSWADQYSDLISSEYARYLALEGSASALKVSHPFLIPALLQLEEYAATLAGSHQEKESAENYRMVELRMQRQDQLLGEGTEQNEPKPLDFLINEEALHRWIGGPSVMAAQLQHVLDLSERPNVQVRVIPYSAGAHPGLLGPSILIQLPDDERAVFNEGRALVEDDPKVLGDTVDYFAAMEAAALPAEQSYKLIAERAEFFATQADRETAGAAPVASR